MKRIFSLALLALLSLTGFAQPVSADLFVSNAHFEDLSGNTINDPNALSYQQVLKVVVNIGNLSLSEAAPGGHFRIRIGLGSGLQINPGFVLAAAPLNNYFSWSLDNSGAQPQIVGMSIATLPANTVGVAAFEVKGVTAVSSTVSYNLLIANPIGTTTPLSDPLPDNNVASSIYTVASDLAFTTSKQNVACYGGSTGSITVMPTGGIAPYTYTLFNNTTNASLQSSNGQFNNLSAATYTITVTDAANNTATGNETISQPLSAVMALLGSQTNVLCYGEATGAINVTASGGTGPITFSITNGTTVNITGQPSGNFTGLAADAYTVTAMDANGCTSVVNVALSQPAAALSFSSVSSTNVACFGQSTGTITASVTGGTGGYSYALSGAGANNSGNGNGSYTGLPAGTYTVTVTDANGCTKTTSPITISQPLFALSYATPVVTNVNCYGQSTGAISILASGGTGPYNYALSGGPTNTTGNFSGLPAGTYSITITDSKGCTTTAANIVVNQPLSALSASLQGPVTNVACYGGNTGSFTVAATGGTGPYSFVITSGPTVNNSGALSGTFSNLPAGTYVVTVTDSKGCTTQVNNIVLSQPTNALNIISALPTNVLCYGQSTGAISVNVSGGTLNYTYAITVGNGNSSGDGNGQYTGLAAGSYVITVTDSKGCIAQTDPVSITQPSSAVTFGSITSTDVACYNTNTGTITASATGGTGTLSFSLSGTGSNASGNTTGQYSGLPAGTYTVTATDGNGCSKTSNPITINQPSMALSSTIPVITNVNCYGQNTGAISTTAAGGTSPYSYSLNGGAVASSGNFSNLFAGTYSITVTDAKGCTVTLGNLQVSQPSQPLSNGSVTKTNNACHGGTDGKITLAVTGGTQPYSYVLSGSTTPNTSGDGNGIYNGLAAGLYSITVTDAKGCTITVPNIVITEPAGTAPDVILSVADYTDNFFPANGNEVTLIFQLSEIGGNPALNDIIKITKQAGYTYSLPNVSTVNVGSGPSAITYTVDNSRWAVSANTSTFLELSLNSGQQLNCGQSVYVALKLTRATNSKTVFTVTSLLRNVTGEVNTSNNSTTVVLVGQ